MDQLCWHPKHTDQVISASSDKTIRLWDARTSKAVASIPTKGKTVLKVCLHVATPSESPYPSPSKFNIVSMADGQNGFHTHSAHQSARHHRYSDKPLTVTESECVHRP